MTDASDPTPRPQPPAGPTDSPTQPSADPGIDADPPASVPVAAAVADGERVVGGTRPTDPGGTAPGLVLGGILVIAGAALLVAQLVDIDIGAVGWPMIIVGIGAVLLAIGLVGGRDSGMIVGGTVTTSVGLLLAYQNATGNWATWAYAWALVGPAASGLGLVLSGLRTGDGSDVRNGTWGLLGGLAFFAIGFLFFEGIIGLSGFDVSIAEWVLPAVVIGIGVVILGRAVLQRDDRGSGTS
jgi:hypothetical protein